MPPKPARIPKGKTRDFQGKNVIRLKDSVRMFRTQNGPRAEAPGHCKKWKQTGKSSRKYVPLAFGKSCEVKTCIEVMFEPETGGQGKLASDRL
jgi:hypothetical protein